MAQRVFLHIGTMKSGTSYLQALWWHHRHELARRGLLVPGDREYEQHFAGLIVRDGVDELVHRLNTRQLGAWERILAETAATTCDAVISNEVFCVASRERARETLRRLSEAAEEVHVVLSTRDLGRILTSAWQQRVKKGRGDSFDEFWREVSTEGPRGTFHRHYYVPGILDRWAPDLPPERVHVVVLPHRGAPRDWLWHRLCEITGIDPTGLATDVADLNESLGLAEVEMLRALNASLRSRQPERRTVDTARFLRQTLVREVLLPADGERFVAPPEARAWAQEQGRSTADLLGSSGWHIVGELADLVPEVEQPGRTVDDVTSAEVAQVALSSLVHLVGQGLDAQQRIHELREEVRRLREADGAPDDPHHTT